MCEKEKCCRKPEQLKGTPQECGSKQIKKCHGTDKGHPCASNHNKQKGE